MSERESLINQELLDTEWLKEFACFLKQNEKSKELTEVKTIFVESYLDGIQEGMKPKEALQKAKTIAYCFLLSYQRV